MVILKYILLVDKYGFSNSTPYCAIIIAMFYYVLKVLESHFRLMFLPWPILVRFTGTAARSI
jgi:hypothetical protein